MSTIILITGANRGLGKALVEVYASRPNTTVIAGVRTLATASPLARLATGAGSKVIAVKIASDSLSDAADAVASLHSAHGITHLDAVIANAGIAHTYVPARAVPIAVVQEHFNVNALGPLVLFQATAALLQAAPAAGTPRFVLISTNVGSLGLMPDVPLHAAAYGASKAAANYLVRKVHFEEEWLTAFMVHPGWVQTEMGNAGAVEAGLERAPNTIEESIEGVVALVDGATREQTAGRFWGFDGKELPW